MSGHDARWPRAERASAGSTSVQGTSEASKSDTPRLRAAVEQSNEKGSN
jgi:hypothetical protein